MRGNLVSQVINGLFLFGFFSCAVYFVFLNRYEAPLDRLNKRKEEIEKGIFSHTEGFPREKDLEATSLEMRKFQQRIETKCKSKYGVVEAAAVPHSSTLRNTLVSNRYKTLFCFVPKVACGNWKRVFLVLNGHFNTTAEISGETAHNSRLLDTLDKYTSQEITQKLETYKKILFVREPLQRVLSAYRNKFTTEYHKRVYHERVDKEIVKKYRGNSTIDHQYATFNEFVKYLIDLRPREKLDIHWKPQHHICDPCSIKYDFIGRYHTLKSDAKRALGIMGVNNEIEFPDIGKRNNGQRIMRQFYSEITENEFLRLRKIYDMDYQLFEYRKPRYSEIFNDYPY
ncbi:carbohydrate sulfotransferase 11-like isoform X1 [Montipora foliosa]|uniref:carbohydrate sulfotransferase 11-like isoform X1 n=1 Tax=Montipora foliosa TaxID=591990 RepID=UPI0035F17620